MRSLFLMSVFGLFMLAAMSGPSLANLTLAVPAYADNGDNADNADFRCPNGITICYKADGTEFTDVNNLPATAAGLEEADSEDDDSEALVSVVKPSHFRTF